MVDNTLQDYFRSRRYSPRVVNGGIDYLVQRWRSLVASLGSYSRGIDEYRDALDVRSILTEAAGLLSEDARKFLDKTVHPLDEEFRKGTTQSSSPINTWRGGDYWWNYRYPVGMYIPGGQPGDRESTGRRRPKPKTQDPSK
jgi:hypothetical protein